jgi:hypothetical protein
LKNGSPASSDCVKTPFRSKVREIFVHIWIVRM